jgi:hypothetical protein
MTRNIVTRAQRGNILVTADDHSSSVAEADGRGTAEPCLCRPNADLVDGTRLYFMV